MQSKKGKIILPILLVFLLVGIVSAIDTQIKIKTMPAHEVNVAIGESEGEGNSWKFFKKISDEYGDAVFDIPVNKDKFDLRVEIKKDGVTVKHSSFDNPYKSSGNAAGDLISLELYPDWFTPPKSPFEETEVVEENATETDETIENETVEVDSSLEETQVVEETENNKELTGSSVAEEHAYSTKTFYYSLGFIVLLMVSFISFLVFKKQATTKRKKGKEKLDNILDDMDSKGKPKKKKKDLVEDVKRKMKDIEEEMEELKKD